MSLPRAGLFAALFLLAGCITQTGEASIDFAADFTDSDGDPGSVAHVWSEADGDIEDDFYAFSCSDQGSFQEISVGPSDSSYSLTFRLDGTVPFEGLDVNLLDGGSVTNRTFDIDSDSDIQPISEVDCTITGGPPDLVLNAECSDNTRDPNWPDATFSFVVRIACPRWASVFE